MATEGTLRQVLGAINNLTEQVKRMADQQDAYMAQQPLQGPAGNAATDVDEEEEAWQGMTRTLQRVRARRNRDHQREVGPLLCQR
jgi:hypothetical protein